MNASITGVDFGVFFTKKKWFISRATPHFRGHLLYLLSHDPHFIHGISDNDSRHHFRVLDRDLKLYSD